ncbi:MAG TPA: HupE/UreJ family protein [Alphaproteobacteria bacterium]
MSPFARFHTFAISTGNRLLNWPALPSLVTFIVFCVASLPAFAGSLSEDLKEARDLIMGNVSEGPFGRGMLYPLFQPAVLASLFCVGLWAGLSTDKLSTIWAIPVAFFCAIVVGAFISEFHPNWRPSFGELAEEYPELPSILTTEGISLIIAVAIGAIVAMSFTIPPLLTLAVIMLLGLALGSSDLKAVSDVDSDNSIIIPFWAGFGSTGLIMTIFGIGFETFAKSVNMLFLIRLAGFFTAVAGLVLVVKTI